MLLLRVADDWYRGGMRLSADAVDHLPLAVRTATAAAAEALCPPPQVVPPTRRSRESAIGSWADAELDQVLKAETTPAQVRLAILLAVRTGQRG